MDKINVAELLKGCPSGMELDCTMYEDVYFDWVDELNRIHCYIQHETHKTSITFNQHGTPNSVMKSKCVIFPKGKTTWEGFVQHCKFKDGDVIAVENELGIHIFIYNHTTDEYGGYGYYVILTSRGNFKINKFCSGRTYRFATEEEKQKLFDAIKANGYKWNPETKTLNNLIEPKFKEGDILYVKSNKQNEYIIIFKEIRNEHIHKYVCFAYQHLSIDKCSLCHLVDAEIIRLATEEEKEKLFKAIKDNGYKWNSETKTFEELIKPKFKVGDRIRHKCPEFRGERIVNIRCDTGYFTTINDWIDIAHQDDWELVSEKLVEPKFKDGDILYIYSANPWICIYKEGGEKDNVYYKYVAITSSSFVYDCSPLCHRNNVKEIRHATEKEKEKLFQAIKDIGYKWDLETKTLNKLIEPKFKVGDTIRRKNSNEEYIITSINDYTYYYRLNEHCTGSLGIQLQDEYELVPDKFDINTLVPFESKVLIRDTKSQKWSPAIWGFYDSDQQDYQYKLVGVIARYCIPYEGNEHLLGKIDDCDEFYKNW